MVYIILAIIAGAMVILSMIINAKLANKIGVLQGTFINYVAGLIFVLILMLVFKTPGVETIKLNNIPVWAFCGGLIGILIVAGSNVIIPKIPAIYTTLFIFTGQIIAGITLDFIIDDKISKGKIIGGLLIVLGIAYNSRIDKKHTEKTK